MNQVKVDESVEVAIRRLMEEAQEKAENSVRMVHKMEVGQVLRQGDVYIHRVADDHAHGLEIAKGEIQLALGASVGQRHFLVGNLVAYEGTTAPEWAKNSMLGPCVLVVERALNTHPEHAHASFPPGVYQVTHQLDWRTRQRVQD